MKRAPDSGRMPLASRNTTSVSPHTDGNEVTRHERQHLIGAAGLQRQAYAAPKIFRRGVIGDNTGNDAWQVEERKENVRSFADRRRDRLTSREIEGGGP